MLVAFSVMAEPAEYQTNQPDLIFLTSTHNAGLVFYSDIATNNTASWTSAFRIHKNFTVTIIGSNQSYSIELLDRNQTFTGNTSANVTMVPVAVNGSSVWILVRLHQYSDDGNATIYNFGRASISSQAAAVVVPEEPETILQADHVDAIWVAIWKPALLIASLVLLAFLAVRGYKRNHILKP